MCFQFLIRVYSRNSRLISFLISFLFSLVAALPRYAFLRNRLSAEIAYHRKSAALFLWLNAEC